MKNERYSIEVSEDIVVIHGKLTIEEAFDFLNFFEKKGFDEVVVGHENSCLRLLKKNEQIHESNDFYKKKVNELESLIKHLIEKDTFVDDVISKELTKLFLGTSDDMAETKQV